MTSVCLVTQLCPTLCDPMDCSSPGSSVHESFQARIFPWVAVSSFGESADPGIKPTEPLHQYKFLGQIRELKLGLLPQLSFLESSSKFRFWQIQSYRNILFREDSHRHLPWCTIQSLVTVKSDNDWLGSPQKSIN